MKIILIITALFICQFGYPQTNKKLTAVKPFICTTFVYNLSLNEMKIRDICINVQKGEFIDMNEFSTTKRKENENWRFVVNIKDNVTMSNQNYKAAFYIYENTDEITQYHPVVQNDEFKAIIYNKQRDSWQILLLQNDEFKILSTYSGYHYTNAFGIKTKSKSSITY